MCVGSVLHVAQRDSVPPGAPKKRGCASLPWVGVPRLARGIVAHLFSIQHLKPAPGKPPQKESALGRRGSVVWLRSIAWFSFHMLSLTAMSLGPTRPKSCTRTQQDLVVLLVSHLLGIHFATCNSYAVRYAITSQCIEALNAPFFVYNRQLRTAQQHRLTISVPAISRVSAE